MKFNYAVLITNLQKPLLITLALLINACAIGPDFTSPKEDFAKQKINYRVDKNSQTSKISWHKEDGNSKWWESFNNNTINTWVDKALKNSPNAKIAMAKLKQAGAVANKGRSLLYPSVSAQLGSSRQKTSTNPSIDDSPTNTYNLYNGSINVAYVFDIFGSVRRANEYNNANLEAQKWETIGAMSTLAANVVNIIINLAATDAQIKASESLLQSQQKQYGISEQQYEIGSISKAQLLPLKAQLASAKAGLPLTYAQKTVYENQLLALCGEYPAAGALESVILDELQIPDNIPLWVPSELVRRRADIRYAESTLHSATAYVGVASSGFYPQIGIAGSLSSQALKSADLFNTTLWSIALSLTQKLFAGGETVAEKNRANAGVQIAQANYQKTVLNAFSEVSNAIATFTANSQSVVSQNEAFTASKSSYAISQDEFKIGSLSSFDLLNAEQTFSQAQIALIKTKAARLIDVVTLYLAAGGSVKLPELEEIDTGVNTQ